MCCDADDFITDDNRNINFIHKSKTRDVMGFEKKYFPNLIFCLHKESFFIISYFYVHFLLYIIVQE